MTNRIRQVAQRIIQARAQRPRDRMQPQAGVPQYKRQNKSYGSLLRSVAQAKLKNMNRPRLKAPQKPATPAQWQRKRFGPSRQVMPMFRRNRPMGQA